MKPQDILFIIIFLLLLWKRDVRLAAGVGGLCLLLAVPLFAKWVFFTAERLTWYGAGFFLLAILVQLYTLKNKHES